MPREVFIAGQILTAAELNTVSDQTVMSFAGTAARGSAIPSPVEGMTTYLNDLNRIEVYNGSAWGAVGTILQVAQAVKTDAFTTTSATYVDVTGLSVNITPSSTSSKILVFADVKIANTAGLASTSAGVHAQIVRDSTALYLGDASGSRTRASMSDGPSAPFGIENASAIFLDTPASSSALTYKIQLRRGNGNTAVLNRVGDDNDDAGRGRTASSITVMEVAG